MVHMCSDYSVGVYTVYMQYITSDCTCNIVILLYIHTYLSVIILTPHNSYRCNSHYSSSCFSLA